MKSLNLLLLVGLSLSVHANDLASGVRNAGFVPFPQHEVVESLNAFQRAFAHMEAHLNAQTPEINRSWRDHLNVPALAKITSGNDRSVESLDRNLWWYFRNLPGLEMDHMVFVRTTGRRYREALAFSQMSAAELEQEFTRKRDRLAQLLDQLVAGQAGQVDHQELGQLVGWMERAKQLPGYLGAIRQHYERPNFRYSLSSKVLLASFQNESISRTEPISAHFNGAAISGVSSFNGSSRAVLTPHPSEAHIDIVLSGGASTSSTAVAPRPEDGPRLGRRFTGENGVATLYSRGYTQVTSTVRLVMHPTGFSILPAVASASSQTQITGGSYDPNREFIFPRLEGLVRRGGAQKAIETAHAQRAAAEAYASQQASSRIGKELNDQVNSRMGTRLSEINKMYSDNLYLPFYRHEIFPKSVHFTTQADRIETQGWMAGYDQFATVSTPPTVPNGSDVMFQAHDSAVNNFLEAAYGWYEATDSYVENFAKTMYGEIPRDLWVFKGTERWSAFFERRRPITVKLGKDRMTVTFRIERLEKKATGQSLPVMLSGMYRLKNDGTKFDFQRIGEVSIVYGSNAKLTEAQITALKEFFTPKLAALLPEAPTFPNLMLPEGISGANLPSLENASLVVDGGWISASWKVAPKKPETPKGP